MSTIYQILNKYASWAQELEEKEKYLRDYVRQLEQQGITVPGWEEFYGAD